MKMTTTLEDIVFDVKVGENAYLQFLDRSDKGSKIIDVKVKGAKFEDLLKFKNKKVILHDVNQIQVDYSKYYNIDDITKIQLLDK
jgi:hypothetical protein